MSEWYVAKNGQSMGPFTLDQMKQKLVSGEFSGDDPVFRAGMAGWAPARTVGELAGFISAAHPPVPPPPSGMGRSDEIDYVIEGHEMQYVEIELDPGESAVSEAGAMLYMTEQVKMETIFGDGRASAKSGLMDKLVGAGKRLLIGESLFMTVFTHSGSAGKQHVAFGAPYPGKVIPMDLKQKGGQIICQKDAFLCAAKGVSIEIAFQKKIGTALFGGEGFIMQKLIGDGLAFLHAGGFVFERQLQAGELLRVDTGCLVALQPSVSYDVEFVGSVKTALFGGEGFFYATLRGPGHVWLQTLPFSRLAGRIWSAAPQGGGRDKGEGSLMPGFNNLGKLLGGS
ncbi:TIGR00266 family protein [bacterium]|nr:TIGR00266 family protein [candidate division CSSED10-310 bacterium]